MILLGSSQLGPNVLLIVVGAFALNRLNALTVPWIRARGPTLKIFAMRASTWFSRSEYTVPGSIRAAVNDASVGGRPRVFWRVATVALARICGPTRFCHVALAFRPHGSG